MQYNTTASLPRNTFFSQTSNFSIQANQLTQEEFMLSTIYHLSDIQKTVARHISYYAKKQFGHCQKTFRTIAAECACSYVTVRRTVKALTDAGLMELKRMGRRPPHIKVIDKLFDFLSSKNKRALKEHSNEPILYIKKEKNINRVDDSFLHKNDSISDKLTNNDLLIMSDLESLDLTLRSNMTILSEIKRLKLPSRAVLLAVEVTLAAKNKVLRAAGNKVFNTGAFFMSVLRNNKAYKHEQALKAKNDEKIIEMRRNYDENVKNSVKMPSYLSKMLNRLKF